MPHLSIQPLLPISTASSISLGLTSPIQNNFQEPINAKLVEQGNRCTQALLSIVFILVLPDNYGKVPTLITGLVSLIFSLLLVEDHMVERVFPSASSEPQITTKVRFSASFVLAVSWMIVGIEWLFHLLEANQSDISCQVSFWVSLASWMSWTLSFTEEPYLSPVQTNRVRFV
ncbi:hypothetical protein CONCODRAFT_11074 [Conidiobolus coronatus NRRL 28638]|uniref:Uncharacterized protein n=1 Tax=Conidiobolus coronatus (strain ATCC 28846 / CBS 209.66 / NRRL 28638) TaxID=796925 RepID=A0A137NWD6_CONC2|nr:hypothetical protein CONCODRAFT_11074 [Conidiobolus coronatus NRRL 28638]|eukprot:KXN66961.1 hypothetical protein CONCODRAFT_11074 [Conidiobolus coronatus NRRL 28638]